MIADGMLILRYAVGRPCCDHHPFLRCQQDVRCHEDVQRLHDGAQPGGGRSGVVHPLTLRGSECQCVQGSSCLLITSSDVGSWQMALRLAAYDIPSTVQYTVFVQEYFVVVAIRSTVIQIVTKCIFDGVHTKSKKNAYRSILF